MNKITRADLKGKKLNDFCYKANRSTHEGGPNDNKVYCYGLIDKKTDELIDECFNCKANVMYAGSDLDE